MKSVSSLCWENGLRRLITFLPNTSIMQAGPMSISLYIDTNLPVSYLRYLRYLLFRKLRSNVHRHSSPPPKQSASSRVQLGQSHLVRESGPRKQQRNDRWPMHSEARAHERPSLPSELLGDSSRDSRPSPAHDHCRA